MAATASGDCRGFGTGPVMQRLISLKHDPEKLNDFSDKIMRRNKAMRAESDSVRTHFGLGWMRRTRKGRRPSPASACRVAVVAAFAFLPRAAAAEDFYAGKTITISTHGGVGGEYDGYLRLLQRFFGKYVPGNPNVVVINQVGAGPSARRELSAIGACQTFHC